MGTPRILPDSDGKIACRNCGDLHPSEYFKRKPKEGIDRRCKRCQALRSARYNARPEIKARQQIYDRVRRADPAKRARLIEQSLAFSKTIPVEKRMWRSALERASEKGLPFSIDVSDVVVPDVCPLLDIPISRGKGKLHAGSPSLDRIDPGLGYVPGNVWVISYRANAMKQDATVDEITLLANRLRERLESPKLQPQRNGS